MSPKGTKCASTQSMDAEGKKNGAGPLSSQEIVAVHASLPKPPTRLLTLFLRLFPTSLITPIKVHHESDESFARHPHQLTFSCHTWSDCPRSILRKQLPTAHCPLPTANCQLPTANCQRNHSSIAIVRNFSKPHHGLKAASDRFRINEPWPQE